MTSASDGGTSSSQALHLVLLHFLPVCYVSHCFVVLYFASCCFALFRPFLISRYISVLFSTFPFVSIRSASLDFVPTHALFFVFEFSQ